MLLERNGDGDRAKETSLLDEFLAISSELGMGPLMERVLSLREIFGPDNGIPGTRSRLRTKYICMD